MLKLNKTSSAKPLHMQLTAYFRERILDGQLSPGTRLPTELELAAQCEVSRDTVRQAMAQLVDEGLLERLPRRGTFVCELPDSIKGPMLVGQKSVGLVLNRPPHLQLNVDILIGVEQAAKSHGYSVSFTCAEESEEQQARDIARLQAAQVLGFIVFPVSDSTSDESIRQLHSANVPLVLIDRYYPDLTTDYVGPDNVAGGFRATEHLLILGYRRIGFVFSAEETLHTSSVRERWEGYRAALQKYNVAYDEALVIPNFSMSLPESIVCFTDLATSSSRPEAIFAVNDFVALDVIQAAKQIDMRVPEDLALVGFDNLYFTEYLSPPLTTVAMPFMEMGLRASNLLISRIEGLAGPFRHIELPTNLVVRESCGVQLRMRKSSSIS